MLVFHVDPFLCLSLCSGPNIYSQSMASLSGDIETPFSLTTTGHQLLLRWSSDHGTNRRGFHIRYVGEYQSMYPVYNHILFLYLFYFSPIWREVIKVMGLQFVQFKDIWTQHKNCGSSCIFLCTQHDPMIFVTGCWGCSAVWFILFR